MSLSLDYSSTFNQKHYNAFGNEVDAGHTSLDNLNISGTYSPSDRVMLNASLPFVNASYRGMSPHPSPVDDGRWHGTVTDLFLSVHFQVSEFPIAFAPYVGALIPTHKYVTMGHAAPGRGLEEYWFGFYAGRSPNDWLPRTYVQTRLNYAFVEEVGNVAHDRTNASFEIGHFLNESWSGRILVARKWTHGGIDVPIPITSPLFHFHDQLAAEELLNLGGGISWTVNDRMTVYGLYMQSLEGENAHKVDHRVSLGVSYSPGGH